jgi:predicted hotdog family 3-hydroxylacyl-ACP dehydratase
MNIDDLPPVSELVPHGSGVILLDRVLEHDGESTTTRVTVAKQAWLKGADGSVASWVVLEYMAQGIAAHEGIRARIEGRPPVRGSVAAAFGVRVYRSCFKADEVLRVRTNRVRGRPGLGVLSYYCAIHEDGEPGEGILLAEGRLSISISQPSLDAG